MPQETVLKLGFFLVLQRRLKVLLIFKFLPLHIEQILIDLINKQFCIVLPLRNDNYPFTSWFKLLLKHQIQIPHRTPKIDYIATHYQVIRLDEFVTLSPVKYERLHFLVVFYEVVFDSLDHLRVVVCHLYWFALGPFFDGDACDADAWA